MLTVRDVMSKDVVAVTPELTLRDAVELFSARRIGGAPVVDGERVVGVLSTRDIVDFQSSLPGVPTERTEFAAPGPEDTETRNATRAVRNEDEPVATYFTDLWGDAGATATARFDAAGSPEWDFLEDHTVGEAMSRAVRSVAPGTPLREAARDMVNRQIHRLIVQDGERLEGVVTTYDLVRAVADGRL
jgi:CBS domain-containing protein